jgi:hypothetical protein
VARDAGAAPSDTRVSRRKTKTVTTARRDGDRKGRNAKNENDVNTALR